MPSVAGNDRYLQRQINRANVAPMGPIILGVGDRIRLVDANGDTVLDLKPGGALVRQNGVMKSLETELGAKSTTVYVDNRVTSLQTQINANDGYRQSGDEALQAGISTLNGEMDAVQSGVSTLNGEMDAVQSGISVLQGQMSNRATTTQMNYVIGVISSAINSIANRVNYLESMADGVTPGQSSYVIPTL